MANMAPDSPALVLPAQQDRPLAIDELILMRIVNTVETEYRNGDGRYRTLERVLLHPQLAGIRFESVPINAGAYRVRQYRFSLIMAADAGSYQLALAPIEGCAQAWFSDQSGAIYSGRQIGC
jgi:hypothetical protein